MEVASRDRVRVLARIDVVVVQHGAEHLVATRDRIGRTVERVEDRRRLRQPGEKSCLVQRQGAGRLREVRLSRCLDPVRVVSVVDLVHVRGQDPLLTARASVLRLLLPGKLDRETRFRRLSSERLRFLLDVEVAHELLGDRGASLDDLAGLHVCVERAHDAEPIECTVAEEAAILDRHGRLHHPGADLRARDRLAVPLRRNRSEQRAVSCVDERVLTDLDGLQGVQIAARHEHGRAGEARDDEDDESAEKNAEGKPTHALTPVLDSFAPSLPQTLEQKRIRRRPAPSGRWAHWATSAR